MNPDDLAGEGKRGGGLGPPDESELRALELEIGLALREIESPRAPATLLPRVMAAARAAALRPHAARPHTAPRPWYATPWSAWPRPWQTASVLALVEVLVAAWTWIPALGVSLPPVGGALSRFLAPIVAPLTAVQADVAAVFRALEIAVRAVEPALGLLGSISMLMLAACVALGAGIGRLALGRRYP